MVVMIVGDNDSRDSDSGYRVIYDEDVFWKGVAYNGMCELVMTVIIPRMASGSDANSKDGDSVLNRVITVVELLTRTIKNCATYPADISVHR